MMKKIRRLSALIIVSAIWSLLCQGQSNTWIQKTDFGGTARYRAVCFSIGAKGYVGTGTDGIRKKDFWEFDPSLNIWTQKADFGGTARYGAVGFSIGAKGYVGTGHDGIRKKDFWEFDPSLNIWTQKADFGGTARENPVGFSIGAKGYIGTGSDGSSKKDFWEFDPVLNSWTQKADFGGTARYQAVGFSIGSKGYIGTGYSGSSKKDIWEFDPSLNTWTQKADFAGTSRYNAVGFSIAGKGYIGTGYSSLKDFWEFDPVINSWTQKTNFGGTGRYSAIGFSIGTKGYIGTGTGGSYRKDLWEYTPDGFRSGLIAGTEFCAGAAVNIPFSVSTPCNPENVFTAQLSDSLGSFSNPVSMGSLSGTSSGTIPGTIPSGSNNGMKYRVRVVSSDPSATSLDNLIDLSIFRALPSTPGPISGPVPGCVLKNNTYFIAEIPNVSSYLWTIPEGTSSEGCFQNSIRVVYGTSFTSGELIVKGHNGCGDGPSSSLALSVMNCGDNWMQKNDFGGTIRNGAVGFSIESKGYIGTGYTPGVNKDFWEFDPVSDAWTQKADFGGIIRRDAVGFSIGDKGYIGAGVSEDFGKDFWEFDPTLDAWTQKADYMGTSHQSPIGFSIGNRGYVGMGNSYQKDFWEFDPLSNLWTQKADFGGAGRIWAVGFSIGAKGYAGTGYTGSSYLKDFWEFDPVLNTWAQKAAFGGTARYGAVGFSIGAKGYIGTGWNGSYQKDFWEFDPVLNTWTQKADFSGTARSGTAGFSIVAKGYVGTGYDGTNKKDFWEFDPILNTWTPKPDFSGTARRSAVGFSIGANGYIGTGSDGSDRKDFWEYAPAGFSTGILAGTAFCAGDAVDIPFTVSASCNAGNTFTAQLSDSVGSFSNPVSVGSLAGTISGTINGTIPFNANNGMKYRIRVVSSDPAATSADNLIDLAIANAVPATPGAISGPVPGCLLKNTTYSIAEEPNANYYQWTLPAGVTGNGSVRNSIRVVYGTSFTSGVLSVKGSNACGEGNATSLVLSVMNCGDNWIQKADFGGTARTSAVGFSIGVKGYIGTGSDGSVLYKDFWEFDPILDTWTQKADFAGTARLDAVGFSIGARGYIGTGADYSTRKDFWEFDPISNTWTQKADLSGTDRVWAVGFSVNAKGYIGTGLGGGYYQQDLWEFDPSSNTWTQKAYFGGTARTYAVGFSIGARGYIGTGFSPNSYKKDFWEFNPILNTWTQKADFGGTVRKNAVGFSIGTKGYIGTGVYDEIKKDFWEFDPVLNTWTQKTDFGGTARAKAVGFSIGSKGYIGTGSGIMRDFWEYTPDGFSAGMLPGDKFCSGSEMTVPFTLPVPCNPGNVFTAQLSDSLGSFANPVAFGTLSGMYSDTIHGTLPALSTNGYKYRIRIQSSDPANTSVDNLYDISVYTATIPGIVSGGTTISLGAQTDTLRLSGNAGSILTWQKQLNGGGYSDISPSSGLVYYIETPASAGTWDYRAVVKNGVCNTEQSAAASVVVVAGPVERTWTGGIDEKWNKAGNWSPSGIPGAQDDVIIPVSASVMPVVQVQGFGCNNIVIRSGATLTVTPGVILTVNGQVTIEGN